MLAYRYQLLTIVNTEKFQVYNTGSRYGVLISDMIIKYSRTMTVGTREKGSKIFLSRTISLKADFDEKSLVKFLNTS